MCQYLQKRTKFFQRPESLVSGTMEVKVFSESNYLIAELIKPQHPEILAIKRYQSFPRTSHEVTLLGLFLEIKIVPLPQISHSSCTFAKQAGNCPPNIIYLLLSDLHIQDYIVNQLRQGFLNSAFEFAIFQESMDKLKNAKDEIFKAQDFTYRKYTREDFNDKKAKGKHICQK